MALEFLLAFVLAFALSAAATPAVKLLAWKAKAVDYPGEPRKIQSYPVASLGGLAVYLGFAASLLLWMSFAPGFFGPNLKTGFLWGILAGGAILMLGGYFDDRYKLPPKRSVIAPVLAVAAIILSGVQLSYINHPLGGAILLDTVKLWGYPLFGGVFVAAWVLGMIYTTKFLDGMDGLVSGIVGLGCIVLFFLSLLPQVEQPDTALLSVLLAGAFFGFLPWNFHPARIFLGEGGSTFAGFALGVLSVISGGKIATALLIMGIPILDVAWVILRRLSSHFSPFMPDRKHLHFRLLDLGLSQRQAVLLLYFISAAFGVSGLFLQSAGKLVALLILFATMLVLGSFLVIAYNRKTQNVKFQRKQRP